jgi:hypothetical protein
VDAVANAYAGSIKDADRYPNANTHQNIYLYPDTNVDPDQYPHHPATTAYGYVNAYSTSFYRFISFG